MTTAQLGGRLPEIGFGRRSGSSNTCRPAHGNAVVVARRLPAVPDIEHAAKDALIVNDIREDDIEAGRRPISP